MKLTRATLRQCTSSESLHLILLPTEACNFRCVYCYEGFALGRMQPAVVEGVKNLLAARAAELSQLSLSWFGGEPLLARDIVEDILRHARSLREEHPRMLLRSDMTTNAWLLSRPVFQTLLHLGVTSYQISFDGPRELHDRKRVLADGRGTFDRIWSHLVEMRGVSGDFTVTVRVHVDRANHDAIREFVADYARVFGDDPRFGLFLRPLSRFGGPNDDALDVYEEREWDHVLQDLTHQAEARGVARSAAAAETPVCYAARGNSFVVRADGRLNKCTIALEHPANQIGRIFDDGHVEIDAQPMQGWMRGLLSGKRMELICPMLGYAEPAQVAG